MNSVRGVTGSYGVFGSLGAAPTSQLSKSASYHKQTYVPTKPGTTGKTAAGKSFTLGPAATHAAWIDKPKLLKPKPYVPPGKLAPGPGYSYPTGSQELPWTDGQGANSLYYDSAGSPTGGGGGEAAPVDESAMEEVAGPLGISWMVWGIGAAVVVGGGYYLWQKRGDK